MVRCPFYISPSLSPHPPLPGFSMAESYEDTNHPTNATVRNHLVTCLCRSELVRHDQLMSSPSGHSPSLVKFKFNSELPFSKTHNCLAIYSTSLLAMAHFQL